MQLHVRNFCPNYMKSITHIYDSVQRHKSIIKFHLIKKINYFIQSSTKRHFLFRPTPPTKL